MAGKKGRFLNFFKEVKSELKKVTWPSFKQVKNNTLIVIACVLIIGAFIWILDAIFGLSLGKVIEKMQAPQAVEQTVPATEQNIPDLAAPTGDMGTEVDPSAVPDANTPQ